MTALSYNRFSRYLHWLMAGLLIFMVILGWRFDDHDSFRLARAQLHKSTGILILVLSFVRLGLRLAYKAPPEIEGPLWQMWAARIVHWGFYVLMIGLPLSGWAMVSTSQREIPFFGLFTVPHMPVPQTHDVHEVFENVHGLLAKLLIYALIPLHVAAALKHHFVDKDETLQHMLPGLTPKPILNWRWIVPIGVLAAAFGFGYLILRGAPEAEKKAPDPAVVAAESASSSETSSSQSSASSSSESSATAITTWTVDKAVSKLNFSTAYEGDAVNGHFKAYQALITFDPAKLEQSHVKVTIDLVSATTGNSDYDDTMKSDSFFGVTSFPKAVFEASKFTKTGKDAYVAKGKLTLHGVTKPFDLPFSLAIKGDVADVKATAELDRLSFGVGSGEFQATTSVSAKVRLDFILRAKAKP